MDNQMKVAFNGRKAWKKEDSQVLLNFLKGRERLKKGDAEQLGALLGRTPASVAKQVCVLRKQMKEQPVYKPQPEVDDIDMLNGFEPNWELEDYHTITIPAWVIMLVTALITGLVVFLLLKGVA